MHVATFTSLAFLFDPLIVFALWKGTADWDPKARQQVLWAQIVFLFGFTKTIKLVGLFRRYPSDIKFLPVSIAFGWFHGLIKLYALSTLKMVRLLTEQNNTRSGRLLTRFQTSWGSRADGDTNDDIRLTRRPKRSSSLTTPSKGQDLIRYRHERQVHGKSEEKQGGISIHYTRPQVLRTKTHPGKDTRPHVTFSLLETPAC